MIFAGVDEAGRGPVLGPLVVAGVVLHKRDLDDLVDLGLTDSKLLSRAKREELYAEIMKRAIDHKVIILPAESIDTNRQTTTNLNKIEFNAAVEILTNLNNWNQAYVDAFDRNAKRLQLVLSNTIQREVVAEHFADRNYPVVSAASIIAKVIRDREIDKLHEEFGVDFGSGYPHDPKTSKFLKTYYSTHNELPMIARKSWNTAKKLVAAHEQKQLDEFFPEDG
ncbi:MAG: ribonuclease HII [Candidatus Heimdallarchaeota archaeon]|nr:ribonuclease HII [Candidatus Heimdallarchaeota archaeon]